MMKLEFLCKCVDKNTGKEYQKGDIVEFEDSRAKEILAVEGGKYAKKAKEPKRKKEME